MLPVQRIAAVAAEYDPSAADMLLGSLPSAVRAGDHAFFIMAFASDTIAVDAGSSSIEGWEEFLNLSVPNNRIIVYRKIIEENTALDAPSEWIMDELDVAGGGALLVFRTPQDLPALASGIVGEVGGDSDGTFTTPSLALATYADIYIAVVFYLGSFELADADAPPVLEVPVDPDAVLAVYVYEPQGAGASGAHVFEYEGSAMANNGAALAFVIAAPDVTVAPTFALDPPGTIGLPVKGI